MPGFQTSHSGNRLFIFAILSGMIIFSAGCSGQQESGVKDQNQMREFLREYEKTFNPSGYDADLVHLKRVEENHHTVLETRTVFTTTVPETLAGYRVQVLFTNNIDLANDTRDTIETLLPHQWCYIVYDAPYYKVRVGNFTDRNEALQMVHQLTGLGYRDAWVVPDNIQINIPPKPPDIEIEPGQPLETHR